MKLKAESFSPYTQSIKNGYILRKFNSNVSTDELVWHRDKRDRIVEVLQGGGWKFQKDDKLPIELNDGAILQIPKETYHRVIRGAGDLIIRIWES